MSNTRRSTNTDPAHAPGRNLSSPSLRPINVSLAVTALACRTYDTRARHACLWLANVAANSQRIQLCWQRRLLPDPLGTIGRITEADLSRKLGLEPIDIYRALTGHDEADLPRFTEAVEKFRAEFEKALPPLVRTADSAIIQEAFDVAAEEHRITTLVGKWRHGKTEECERIWLMNLHRCILVHTPCNNDERTFIFDWAMALGISTGTGKKPTQVRQQIKRAHGIGLIEVVMFDEGQNLWPGDLVNSKPIRAEYVREMRDTVGLGSVIVTTEQFGLQMELAKQHNTRYAPGQIAGRRDQFLLRDVHTDKEIMAIAKLHAGRACDEALSAFVAFAKADEGYLGIMTIAIQRARRSAERANGKGAEISAADAATAIKAEQVDDRTKALLVASKPTRRGRFAVLDRRAA